jgi:putative oxidoreductase
MLMRMKFLARFREEGLLLLRLGLGVMFMVHGGPKLLAGPDKWLQLGGAMKSLGISWAPLFWGLLAALSEFCGGIGLILGLLFRPACLCLTVTMGVATLMHFGRGDGLLGASHALELGVVFLSLMLIGPGRYSLDRS